MYNLSHSKIKTTVFICDEYAEYVDFYNSLKKKEKKKLNDEKFASRIVQNPKIGFWEKLLDKMKR